MKTKISTEEKLNNLLDGLIEMAVKDLAKEELEEILSLLATRMQKDNLNNEDVSEGQNEFAEEVKVADSSTSDTTEGLEETIRLFHALLTESKPEGMGEEDLAKFNELMAKASII